jgi:TetR/AcrR family transcriptional regulator, cholesterol catabolism regulator
LRSQAYRPPVRQTTYLTSHQTTISTSCQSMVSRTSFWGNMTSTSPRQRILDAALDLASRGGYDALQVRAIAQRASVSSRTIYEHFPSLDSLLIIAAAERAGDELYRRLTDTRQRNRTPAARVQRRIDELTEVMTANRQLAVALLRALLCGKPDVAQHVRNLADILRAILASAIAPNGPSAADREAAELLERVWFSALIGWATSVDADDRIHTIMRRASLRILKTAD